MGPDYAPLESKLLRAGTTFSQPASRTRRVSLDDPAIAVMTDFTRVRAVTVPASVSMPYAADSMHASGVHLLLVTDEKNTIVGLVTSTDIEGEKPLRLINERRVRRDEITVRDIMTPVEQLEAVDMGDVLRARVGDVVATLKAVGRQHAIVVDRDEARRYRVRGLFSVSQLNRQLGTVIESVEIVRSFAEVERALFGA